jgi:hypothetical protein
MIAKLQKTDDPLAQEFEKANSRAENTSRMARKGGDYPLLSGGDTNFNSLFVERAQSIIAPGGIVGLLIPSGIATETSSQEFFSRLIEGHAASCYLDFFNKRADGPLFFPDVYYRFKFSVLVFSGGEKTFDECRFATFVRDIAELNDPRKVFSMGVDHFRHVNPNSKTAPVYRAARDREIATVIYERYPRSRGPFIGCGGQSLAGEVYHALPHGEFVGPVSDHQGTSGKRRRLARTWGCLGQCPGHLGATL